MEYLMTYGWAILIVLVVGGVLYYYGIFSPGGMMPKKGCPSGQITIDAADWNYDADAGNMSLIVGNKVGDPITISEVNVSTADGSDLATPDETVGTGEKSGEISVSDLPDTGSTGDSVRPTVTITYDVSGGLSDQKTTCELSGSMS